MSIEELEWVTPGGEVFIKYRGSYGTHITLTRAKIEKVSKSRVTVKVMGLPSRQFYIPKHSNDLREYGVDYYRASVLIPTDSPEVEQILEAGRRRLIENAARTAAEHFGRSRSVENAQAAVEALTKFIAEFSTEENL